MRTQSAHLPRVREFQPVVSRRGRLLLVTAAILGCLLVVSVRNAEPAHALWSTFTVNTVTDDNPDVGACTPAHCSLRDAINAANANNNGETDVIVFDLAGSAPWTLLPAGPLPAITEGVTIDGFCATCDSSANTAATSQPIDAVYSIVLNGALAGDGISGLTISTTEAVTIRGLVISNWDSSGIRVNSAGDHVIAGNFIGTSITGTAPLANNAGITVLTSDGLTIGGANPADRNLISGNTTSGINACSGNADDITIRGNFIGAAASGTAAIINGGSGITLCNNNSVQVGGSLSSGHTNVISGNWVHGVDATGVTNLSVQGNRIGTTRGGTAPLPNGQNGVRVVNSITVSIGGIAGGHGNTIGGNFGDGLYMSGTNNVLIRANSIGIPASGATITPNGGDGIELRDVMNAEVQNNYIGNNFDNGIVLDDAMSDIAITSNFIGTTFNGTASGNGDSGILLNGDLSQNVTIGGASAGNIIVNNGGMGILASDGTHTNLNISGNAIGVDGAQEAGNAYAGIMITFDASGTVTIGEDGAPNTIRYNGDDGIASTSPDGIVTMRYNVVANNGTDAGDLPIDLGPSGDTPNDAGDADEGANGLQNYPLFDKRYSNYVKLTLDSVPFGTYTVDLYQALCLNGRAHPIAHLGTTTQATGVTGALETEFISATGLVAPGSYLTATATDASGRTSEVNPDCTVTIPAVLIADLGGLGFYPGNRTIERGTELTFVNRHIDGHQATSDPGSPAAFTTGLLATRSETTVLFDTAGVYTYSSDTHPGLVGIITVTGSNPDPDITGVDESNLFATLNSTVLLSGTGFISGSVVELDDVELKWSFSGSDILAEVPAGLLPAAGSATIRVTNPAPVDPDGLDEFVVTVHRSPADVDCDLDVDAVDALAVVRMLAGFTDGVLPQICAVDPIFPAGDANQDGSEDIADVLFIRLLAAGIG